MHETRRDRWGATNPYFDSDSQLFNLLNSHRIKIGICGLYYHPSDPFLFCGFFNDPCSPFEIFKFYTSLLPSFAIYLRIMAGSSRFTFLQLRFRN